MAKITITADCSSGLEYANFKHNIGITRTVIHFGQEELLDGVDITADEFYEKVKSSDVVPSTSAPSPKELLKQFELAKENGCTDVIHFGISWGLSDYGKNLESSIEELIEGIKVHSFNPKFACIMQGYIAKYGEICSSHGLSVEEIYSECEKFRDNIRAFFIVDDLKYLVKNGRLSSFSGMLGSLLKVKPIIHFDEEGHLVTLEKVRTTSKALDRCIELLLEHGSKFNKVIYVALHTARKEDNEEVARRIKNTAPNAIRVETSTITPTVGAHIGAGLLGMCAMPIDGLKFGDELENLVK